MPTDKQIRALKTEAAEHGDDMQWLVCERALEADFDADDYTGGGHDITPRQWVRLGDMTQEEARALCGEAMGAGAGIGGATDDQIKTIRDRAYNATA
jgi:hypothetical protein